MTETKPPDASEPVSETPPIRESFYEEPVWKRFYAFLLGPALLAAVAMAIFTIGSLLTTDETDPHKLVETLRQGGEHRRWQAAFKLTKYLQPSATDASRGLQRETDEVYQAKLRQVRVLVPQLMEVWDDPKRGDGEVRRFLALTFSYLGDERTLSRLGDALGSDDLELVHYALAAIGSTAGAMRGPVSKGAFQLPGNVEQKVLEATKRNEADIRATAMFTLSILGTPTALDRLREGVGDMAPSVAWTAAFGLARHGDETGSKVIAEILDRGPIFAAVGADPGRQSDLFLNAVRSAGMVPTPMLWQRLEKIAQSDRNLGARNEAKKLLEKGSKKDLEEG